MRWPSRASVEDTHMDYIDHHSFSIRHGKHIDTVHTMHGYSCAGCGSGYSFPVGTPIRSDVQEIIDTGTCPYCSDRIAYGTWQSHSNSWLCCGRDCNEIGQERTSLGLYAGHWCDHHYATAFPYRKAEANGFDPSYAGERYDDDY
jgi:DNA-directed RNA polymerase subunit RPC12/RpoP